jgi:hypothetical protein
MRTTSERMAILAALEEAAEPIGPNDIAAATGMKPEMCAICSAG